MNRARQTPKNLPNTLRIVAGFILITISAFAADVKVIANGSVKADSISVDDLRSVFLVTRKTLKDGSPVVPVLNKSSATHEAFVETYLHRDVDELRTYYQGLVFTGKGSMPREFGSDAEVAIFVASTKGAIGYVDANFKAEGVKLLLVLSSGRNAERRLLTRVEPEYPETLKQLHIGGTVRLAVTISPKGAVEGVELLGGNPILGEAAAKAAKQWIYAPASSRTTVEVSIPFEARP
ncbi:MAG TPA: energy transducer TonB [Candidatus Binatia bacterium]|jgi:TonB family protein|nr:energy transducer TonB [Candidatus Binatia bacterium]